MKKLLTAITLTAAMFTAQAQAWGDREQGILTGIVVSEIFRSLQKPEHVGTIQPNIVDYRRKYGIVDNRAHSYDRYAVCRTEKQTTATAILYVKKNCRDEIIEIELREPPRRY